MKWIQILAYVCSRNYRYSDAVIICLLLTYHILRWIFWADGAFEQLSSRLAEFRRIAQAVAIAYFLFCSTQVIVNILNKTYKYSWEIISIPIDS